MATMLFVVTMILALVGYFYVQRKARHEMKRRFDDREHLDIERVCDLFCEGGLTDRQMVQEVVEHVASVLSVNPSLLRPSDRFEFELKPPRGSEFDSDRNTLLLDLAHLAKKRKQPLVLSSIKTLNDYLQAMMKVY